MDITRLIFSGAEDLRQPRSPYRLLSPDYFILIRRPIAVALAA
jgi:hypothetical protein